MVVSTGSFSYSPMLLYMVFFLSQSYTPCAGVCREHLLLGPELVYTGSFSYMPMQCWFTCGVSLTHPMLASFLGSFSRKVYAGFFM